MIAELNAYAVFFIALDRGTGKHRAGRIVAVAAAPALPAF
jgi:hypothetical protein